MVEVCYQPSSASKRSLSVCACTFPCSSPPKTFPSRLFVDLPDVWTAPESPRSVDTSSRLPALPYAGGRSLGEVMPTIPVKGDAAGWLRRYSVVDRYGVLRSYKPLMHLAFRQ
jgi:hypothetical protein